MEPKKTPSKTALFILVNLMFCIEFAQGFFDTELLKAHDLPIDYDLRHEIAEKIHEFQQEIGDGTCSKERINQLRGDTDCLISHENENSKIEQLTHENINCSDVDWFVQCNVSIFEECYTTQESTRKLNLILEYIYVFIKEHNGNLAIFETCKNKVLGYGTESPPPETKNKAGSIVGINMGLLNILFFIVTYYDN